MDEKGSGGTTPQCDECGRWIHSTDCSRRGEPAPRVGGPELDSFMGALDTLRARAGGLNALTLHAAIAQLQVAEGLLLRCEANLPRHLEALLADVRAFVGIDPRGQRVDPTHKS